MPGLTPKSEPFFRDFVNNANKLSLHPLDWDRWYDFVHVCHYLKVELSGEEVERLLEEEGFPEESAKRISNIYSSGRRLLKGHSGYWLLHNQRMEQP